VIVADASAILEVLLRTSAGAVAETRLLRRGETIHAPALIDLEVAQVLRRYVARGEMTPARARAAIDTMAAFPVERYVHDALLLRIWELRVNLTAYDAAYVALAEGLGVPLLTCDARLANAPGIRTVVELIDES
jgi:predicted nucleic acid-binding protein